MFRECREERNRKKKKKSKYISLNNFFPLENPWKDQGANLNISYTLDGAPCEWKKTVFKKLSSTEMLL